MPLSTLNLKFGMDLAEITSGVNKMEKELGRITKSIKDVQTGVAAGMAAIGAGMVFKKIVDGAVDAQKSMAQVQVAIKSTGGAAGMSAVEIDKMANAMKRQTGIDDDLIKSMASVLLTFTKVGKEVFPQATKAIIDMSVRMGGDLQGAAVQVGKALNDPIKGMTALSKVGVSFTENQKAAVKQMVETGHAMDAQKLILKELQTEFGGAAAAARDTLGGALQAMQQNIDDAVDSLNGSEGLREAVEFVNVVLEDFTDYMTGLRQPTSQASKDIAAIGKVLNDVGGFFRGFANVMINGWRDALGAVSAFYKGMTDVGVALSRLISVVPALGGIGKAIKLAFPQFDLLGKAASFAGQRIKEAASKDNFQYFDSAVERSKKKMLELAAAAKNVKGPSGSTGNDGDHLTKAQIAAAKKAAAELKKEEKTIHDVIAAYAQKNVELQASLDKNKGIAEQMAAEKKISDQINVPLKERLTAIAEIGRLSRERLEIEKKIAIEGEKVKLTDYLAGLEDANQKIRNQLAGQKELNPLIAAEQKIRELVKIGLGENLALQEEIRKKAQEQVDLLKEVDHQAALKELKGISDEQQKQVEQLRLKLNGEEDLIGLYEQEKKIRENINLSDDEKNKAIASGRDAAAQVKQLTNSLEAQQDTIKDITGSSDSYKKKIDNLSAALRIGRINSKQWDDAAKDLWEAQKKNSNQASDFSNKMSEGFSKALSGTKSLKAGLLDLAKTSALLVAQEFMFKPFERGVKGLANKFFGGGDNLAKPVNPLTGPQALPTLANNVKPVGSTDGFGTADSTNLYSASSTLQEIRDLLKKQGDALASSVTKTSGGILGLPPMEPLGGGRLSTGNSNTSEDALFKAWEKRMKRSGGSGKDANGAGIEDFEYYSQQLDRATAAQKLGVVKEATNTFKGISNGLNDSLKKLTKPISESAMKVFSPEGGLFSGLKSAFAGIASSIGNAFNGLFSGLKTSIGGMFGNLFGGSGSGGLLSGIGKAVGSLGSSLMGSVSSWFGGGASGGGNLLSGLGKAAGSIGSSLGASLGSWGSLFGIGKREWGGNVNGGSPYLTGENGPELFVPSSSGYIMNNGATRSMFGQYGGMGGGDQYSAALSDIGGYQRQLQSGLTQDGKQLGYWDRQELSQKVQDKYKYTMNWNSGDERMLAQVSDDMAKAQARAWLQNPTKYNGVVNDNEYARMTLRAQYGTGAVDVAVAGGRVSWGAGDQMGVWLDQAAQLGVPIPRQLRDKAEFDAKNWSNSQSTFNPTGNMDPFNWIGRGSYHSQGMGAGEGNTNNGAVYGGDFWDTNSGANGSERMDAMGGKDFMWQKFHGFKGSGYENVKDMWQKFHSGNYSYGGGNYVGDKNYGKTTKNFAFQGPTNGGPSIGGIATPNYGDGPGRGSTYEINDDGTMSPIGGYSSGYEDWMKRTLQGKYAQGHSQKERDDALFNATKADQIADTNRLRKQLGNPNYEPELGTIAALKQYMKKFLANSNSAFTGDRKNNGGFTSADLIGKQEGLNRDSWAARKNTQIYDNQRMGEYLNQIMEPLDGSGLRRIESHMTGTVSGGAVGSGRLSTSLGNDVFDSQNYGYSGSASARLNSSQRMNTQYKNFAEGYGDGVIGARLGAFTGQTAPKGGWSIRGYEFGGRPEPGVPSWVGENGKELFVPDQAGRIIPNNQLNRGANIQLINNTGVQMAKPRYEQKSDGSIGLYLSAAGANLARGGVMAAGSSQVGKTVNR